MRKLLLLLTFVFLQGQAAFAGSYPSQPIRLVVPTGAGGITDILARILAQKLTPILGQSVVIENKSGASGVAGSAFVAHARPDGYTLLMSFPAHVINPSTMKSLPYDTVKAFAPVSKVSTVSEILLVAPNSPYKNLKQFIAKAKAKPNGMSYGSVGVGSLGDLATLELEAQAGISMLHVPYPGEPDVMVALIRNDIQGAFISPVAAIPMIRSGKVRALAISSPQALPMLPGVRPVASFGLPGFDVTGWNAVFAPAGTPADVVATLNAGVIKALADPALIKQFHAQGVEPLGCSPAALQKSVVDDIAMIGQVLKKAGVQPS